MYFTIEYVIYREQRAQKTRAHKSPGEKNAHDWDEVYDEIR